DVFRRDAGVLESPLHATGRAVGIGIGDVERVGAHAVPDYFRVDAGAAFLRVFQFLQHEHAGPFAHHEPVALRVKGSAGFLRLVVAGAHGAHRAETGHADGADGRFRAAANHHVRVAPLDD